MTTWTEIRASLPNEEDQINNIRPIIPGTPNLEIRTLITEAYATGVASLSRDIKYFIRGQAFSINRTTRIPAPTPTENTPTQAYNPKFKVKEPDTFNGTRSKLDEFLRQLNTYFHLFGTAF
ncbi:hypothetical protein SLS57_012518 [Botryosphaeria dothidea]